MKTIDALAKRSAESTTVALSPEVAVHGTRLPRRLAWIPEWIDPEQVNSKQLWSADDETKLAAAVVGTTPTGREIIQRLRWRRQKHATVEQVGFLDLYRPLLNPSELALLQRIMARGAEGTFIADNLWRVDYRRRPPSMQEFITEPSYLGTILHRGHDGGIWPAWFKILCDEFDRDSFLHNVVLTGAIGTGKTTVMVVVLLYRICLVLLLKRPAEMLEQGADSALYFAIVSVTREAAQQTAFTQAVNLMAASPFFREMCGLPPGGAPAGGDIELARAENNDTHTPVHLISGSKPHHLIGRNVVGVGLDEGNHRLESDQDAKAFALYEAMRTRVLSRLKTRDGFLSGITIISSSARDESSLTEQVRLEIEASGKPHEQRVFQKAVDEVKPLPNQSLVRWFKVAYGLAHQVPTLLPGTFDAQGKFLDAAPDIVRKPLPPEAKIATSPVI